MTIIFSISQSIFLYVHTRMLTLVSPGCIEVRMYRNYLLSRPEHFSRIHSCLVLASFYTFSIEENYSIREMVPMSPFSSHTCERHSNLWKTQQSDSSCQLDALNMLSVHHSLFSTWENNGEQISSLLYSKHQSQQVLENLFLLTRKKTSLRGSERNKTSTHCWSVREHYVDVCPNLETCTSVGKAISLLKTHPKEIPA